VRTADLYLVMESGAVLPCLINEERWLLTPDFVD
jgi:hypothetical protein